MAVNRLVLAFLLVMPLAAQADQAPAPAENKGYVAGAPADNTVSAQDKDRLPTLKEFLHGNGSGNGSRKSSGNCSINLWEGVRHMDDWLKKNLW